MYEQKHCLCYFCCNVLDSFIKLQYHEKWIHEGRKEQQIPELKNSFKYICKVFGLIFKYCALLKNHASVHGRTKEQFECEVCGVVWKSRWLLQQHQISHSKHQERGGTVCHTISKTSQYFANPCEKQSWYWKMFLPVFDVNVVTNSYCYNVSGNYLNIHKGEHHFRCKGCNRHCSYQKSLSIHQAMIHRVY
jgi:hypothetical protein